MNSRPNFTKESWDLVSKVTIAVIGVISTYKHGYFYL